jgi:8-oxo-dGTP diphosphatase
MIDRLYQLAYTGAYQLMRVYWSVRHPDTHGALVAVWHEGKILLVKNSYLKYWSLPGGYVRAHETAKQAAVRELLEEVGISVDEERLQPAVDVSHEWEGKRDHVEIFSVDVSEAPRVAIDNREVIDARVFVPEDALRLDLFPPIRKHIEDVLAKRPRA